MPNWHIYLCIVQLQDNIKISDLITQGLISKQHQDILHIPMRRGGRVVEGARLESVYTSKAYRGFESLSLRHCLALTVNPLVSQSSVYKLL